MHDFARMLGFANLGAGILLLVFPSLARPIMEARAEYARLSDNALRLLGVWSLLMGGALVGIGVKQGAGLTGGEVTLPRSRVVA